MLCNLRSIDAAVKIAYHHNLHGLMERMSRIQEIKMREEEDRDPEAEADMIMANPVLAEKQNRDQSAYRVSSRAEEQELERRTFQRKDPVTPNDPFGRRVVKESSFSKSTGQGSSSSTNSASNPFKKKSENAGGSRGFGMVKDTDSNALPITRRATDVFQAADYLAADEQRSRSDQEKLARQEESLRKRKANNGPSNNGGQKTLDLFGKGSSSSSSSSGLKANNNAVADAKRFKRQETQEEEKGNDADTMMEADDFLEEDPIEDREESMPPAAQVIPSTQNVRPREYEEEDDGLGGIDHSIELTRDRLEKSQMQGSSSPSPPQPRSSSSVLAGFKFSK